MRSVFTDFEDYYTIDGTDQWETSGTVGTVTVTGEGEWNYTFVGTGTGSLYLTSLYKVNKDRSLRDRLFRYTLMYRRNSVTPLRGSFLNDDLGSILFDGPIGEWVEVTAPRTTLITSGDPLAGVDFASWDVGALDIDYDFKLFQIWDVSIEGSDPLSLEVERDPDPGALVNLVENPSGEQGAWGWETPVAGSTLAYENYHSVWSTLEYTTAAAGGGNYFYTEPLPVVAGQYVAASWYVAKSPYGYHRARFDYLTSGLAANGQSGWTTITADGAAAAAAVLLPASTAYVRLRIEVGGSAGAYPYTSAGSNLNLRLVTVATAATSAALVTTRRNIIKNPSATVDTTGWVGVNGTLTRSAAPTPQPAGSWAFRVQKTSAGSGVAIEESASGSSSHVVSPGQRWRFRAPFRCGSTVPVGTTLRFQAYWSNASSTDLGDTSVGSADLIAVDTWQEVSGEVQVPAGATRMAVRCTAIPKTGALPTNAVLVVDGILVERVLDDPALPTTYFDGSTAAAGGWTYAWTGTANNSESTAVLSQLSYIEPIAYTDIMGDSNVIGWTREELDVGTLSATVVNPTLDPSIEEDLRPGRRFRVRAFNPATSAFEPLILGRTSNAKVDYYPLNGEGDTARISLTGQDNITTLANAQRPQSVGTIDELPYVLEGAGVPWNCNGSGNQVPSATVIVENDNTSAVDQIALTRDTESGFAWMDRWGVLQAHSSLSSLTPYQAVDNGTFEASLSPWTGTSATAARTNAQAHGGSWSASLTATAAVSELRLDHAYIAVRPGDVLSLAAWGRAAVTARNYRWLLTWYESDGTYISQTTSPLTAGSASAWTQFTGLAATAPPGAARVSYSLVVRTASGTMPIGEVHYFDDVTITVTPFKHVLDDTVYNPNIIVDFDTDRCINSVGVLRQWTHSTEGPQGTLYGPYTDDPSIEEWGRHHVEINVAGTSPAAIPAYAAAVLAANGTPQVRVQSLQIPITTVERMRYAFIDLYDLVTVTNDETGISADLRVVGVSHEIQADEDGGTWLMTLTFASEGGIATPTQQPPLQGSTDVGIPMLDMEKNGSTYSLADATESLITGWTINTDNAMGTISGSSVVIEHAGLYLVSFTATFPAGASGRRVVDIRKTSATGPILVRGGEVTTATAVAIQASLPVRLDAGEVVCGTVYKTGGGSMTLGGTSYLHHFTVTRISD